MEKVDGRKLTKDELKAKRLEVIRLWQNNVRVMEIVRQVGLSWPAVKVAISKNALTLEKRGRKQGTGRILNEQQEAELCQMLYRKRPWQLGIKQAHCSRLSLWTREAVMQLIKQKYVITMTDRGLGKYLLRWGFPRMKQLQRPRQRCTQEIQEWLTLNYANLVQRSRSENTPIYWVSRKQMTVDQKLKYSAKKRPQKLSMVSAIDCHGKEYWLVVWGNFDQEKQIRYLKSLQQISGSKLIVIRNNADYFTENDIASWLLANQLQLNLYPPLLKKEIARKAKKKIYLENEKQDPLRQSNRLIPIAELELLFKWLHVDKLYSDDD